MVSLKDFSKNSGIFRDFLLSFHTPEKTKPKQNQPQIKGGKKSTLEIEKHFMKQAVEVLQYLTSTWDTIQRVNCILPYSNYALANVPCMTAL